MPWDLIGNEQAVAALRRALETGAVAHAYLFAGPVQAGKATLALKLAQALNCRGGSVTAGAVTYEGAHEPCGECDQCRRIAAGLHPDVQTVTIQTAEDEAQRRDISVDQVREVERAVALNPFEGRSRVIIIDPAHALSREAQNAFLKTLEEPPPRVVFILVTDSESALLPTIRSRCRRLELRPLPAAAVCEALLARGLGQEQAELLARLARGRIGWALAMAADPAALGRRADTLRDARSLPSLSMAERMALAERLAAGFRRDRRALLDTLGEWQGWWRDVLIVQSGAEEAAGNADLLPELREDASAYARPPVVAFVQALASLRRYLTENVQPRLALEALLLETPSAPAPAR